MGESRRAPDVLRDVVTGPAGHGRVHQDDVGRRLVDGRHRLVAVTDRDHVDVFIGKGQLDDTLDGLAVVREQQVVWHLGVIGSDLA